MNPKYLRIEEPARAPVPRRLALWDLGFRPFYLLAALLALLSVPLWALQFSGWLPAAVLRGAAWHAHEMVFGYALAVVIGFLYTAGRNWSGQPTPTGPALMALAALWLLGRVLVLTPFALAAAVVNVAVPWLAAWGLWRALHAAGNRRNYFFVALLALLGVAAAAFHAAQAGALARWPGLGLPVALDVVLFMIAVMAGRVIPMFTNNGIAGLRARRHDRLEPAALGTVVLLALADAALWRGAGLVVVLLVALLTHGARFALWQPWRTRSNPLVWSLHAAYAWLPLHLALRIGAELGWVGTGAATHALTVGLIGGITLAMMTRTALGHTGRPLRAGRWEVTAYLAVHGSAALRVGLPLVWPQALVGAVLASAALWAVAYAAYLWRYTPLLCAPRPDGQPG